MTATKVFDLIRIATRPEDVFGPLDTIADLKHRYREIAKAVHPDLHGNSSQATNAFAQLQVFESEAIRRIEAKIYGKSVPTPAKPSSDPTVIERKGRHYIVGDRIARGDLCDVYHALYADSVKGEEVRCVVKVVREGSDNDLVSNEAAVLKAIYPSVDSDGKGIRYMTWFVDTFKLPDPALGPRQVNILRYVKDAYTLEEVRASYPNGIVLEDAVWMFNRLMEGLGYVHRVGYIHGAVIPPHVMVRPKDHGAKLIDWSYAVKFGEKVKALSSPWRDFYAPEIIAKISSVASTDIYMAARCIIYVLGGKDFAPVPRPDDLSKTEAAKRFAAFLNTCIEKRIGARVNDAWQIRKSMEDLMLRYYGPKRFHDFRMPAKL